MPRPSGTSASPASTIRCGGCVRERSCRRATISAARLARHHAGDRLQQRGLAGAVGAEDDEISPLPARRRAAPMHVASQRLRGGRRRTLSALWHLKHRASSRDRRGSPPDPTAPRSGVPSAIFAPLFITTQRSHRVRIASITCSTMMMVRPSSRRLRISAMPILQLGRVEAGQPFVEQQHARIGGERARQLDPLLVDVGQRTHRHARSACARPTRSSCALGMLARLARPTAAGGRTRRRPSRSRSRSSDGSMRTSWKVRATPARAMSRAGLPEIGARRGRCRPTSGFSAPEIRFSIVVLPEPFGPIRPSTSCSRTSKLTRR